MAISHLFPNIRPSLDLNFAATKRLDPRISFSRSSSGTYFDANGVIQSASTNVARFDHNPSTGESLGLLVEEARTNWITYGQYPHLSPWESIAVTATPNVGISPDATSTASLIVPTTANTAHFIRTGNGSQSSTSATGSAYVKAAGYSRVQLYMQSSGGTGHVAFDLSTGTVIASVDGSVVVAGSSIVSVGNGWYRISMSGTSSTAITVVGLVPLNASASASSLGPSYAGDGTSGIFIWGAQLESGSFPTSYIPTPATFTSRASSATYYDANGVIQTASTNVARSAAFFPDSNGVMRPAGLLLEAAGTNLVTYSQEFDNAAWTATNVTITPNLDTAPDGNATGDRVTVSTSSAAALSWGTYSTVLNTAYAMSVYVKPISMATYSIGFTNNFGDSIATFTLLNTSSPVATNGTWGSGARIERLSSGWLRLSVVFTAPRANTTTFQITIGSGTASDEVALWGAQLEASPYPTSYIATADSTVTRSADVSSSATVTRSADAAQITGTNFSSWWNASNGSFLFSHKSPTTPSLSTYFYLVTEGGGSTVNGYRIASNIYPADGSGNNAWSTTGAWLTTGLTANESAKLAFGFTNGSAAAVKNGVVQETNTENLAVVSPTALSLASNVTSTISRLTYWPTRLPDATLQTLTR